MNNCSRFMKNKDCEYYPCHKGIDDINCLFCYCPFYAWSKCPGANKYIEKPDGRMIKVCTDCLFPHIPENYDKVISLLIQGEEGYINSLKDYADDNKKSQENINTPNGVFYGVGVGPGNPELVTLEAKRVILESDVLVFPAKDRESCRAYQIAVEAVPKIKSKQCLFTPFPMSMKEPELSQFHREMADEIEEFLKQNKTVSLLTIGDVTIYSTVIYINKLLCEDGFETRFVAGISSFSAAASRLNIPLTIGSESLHIVPGSGDVNEALKQDGTIVFMKSGKRLIELKNILLEAEKSMNLDVKAVSNCGTNEETVANSASEIAEEMGYLTVVIVRHKE